MQISAADALTIGMLFEGGTVELGDIAGPSNLIVRLIEANMDIDVSPGEASVLPFEIDHAGETQPVQAVMLQFEGADSHVEVDQTVEPAEEPVPVMLGYTVDDEVCDGLCARVHEVTLLRAVRLSNGQVSESVEATVKLDCRQAGDPALCPLSDAGPEPTPLPVDSGFVADDASDAPSLGDLPSMLSAALREAHDALCTSCSSASRVPCYAIVPSSAIACIEAALTSEQTAEDTVQAVQTLLEQVQATTTACMTCDFEACSPGVLTQELTNFSAEPAAAIDACLDEAQR